MTEELPVMLIKWVHRSFFNQTQSLHFFFKQQEKMLLSLKVSECKPIYWKEKLAYRVVKAG